MTEPTVPDESLTQQTAAATSEPTSPEPAPTEPEAASPTTSSTQEPDTSGTSGTALI